MPVMAGQTAITGKFRDKLRQSWVWLLPVGLAGLIYLPALSGGLVWDDPIVVNKQILHFKNAADIFFPHRNIPQWASNYYRPAVVMTYLLDRTVFGPAASTGPHLSNILFHMIVTLFVWMFATQCLRNLPNGRWGAIVAAGIFAVHPIHTESVCWVTGRSDMFGALFMLPGIVTALYYRDQGKPWALVLAPMLFLLALFSKEVTLSTLVVLPVVFWLVPALHNHPAPAAPALPKKNRTRRQKKKTDIAAKPGLKKSHPSRADPGSWLVLGCLYLIATLIYFVFRHHAHVGYGSFLDLTPGHVLSRAFKATAYYLLKTVVPAPQLHFVPAENLPGIGTSLAILLVAGIGIGVAVTFFSHFRRILFISMAWFWATLLPSLSVALLKISETPVAERYLYLPSIGFCLFLGAIFCFTLQRKRFLWASMAMAIIIITGYGVGTLRRESVWQDDIRLWSDATRKASGQGLPWTELGMAYTTKDKLAEGFACFRKAIQAHYDNEGRSIAYNNMGMIYLRQHQLDKAESSFAAAIRQRPRYSTPHYGLGLVAMGKARRSDSPKEVDYLARNAAQHFKAALRLNPKYTKALWGLTRALWIQGTSAENVGHRKAALEKYRAALDTYEQLVQIDPQFVSAHPAQAKSIATIRAHWSALNRRSER